MLLGGSMYALGLEEYVLKWISEDWTSLENFRFIMPDPYQIDYIAGYYQSSTWKLISANSENSSEIIYHFLSCSKYGSVIEIEWKQIKRDYLYKREKELLTDPV